MRIILCFLLLLSCPAFAQLNADFSAVSTQGCAPYTVQFQDNSTGSPSGWFWDFGNGITSYAQNPSVIYTQNGKYNVRLIIKNAAGQDYEEKDSYIEVFITPKPAFIFNIDSGCAPLPITFTDLTDLSGITIKSRLWNFGDNTTSSQQNPVHTFSPGNFNISLTTETMQGCIATDTVLNAVQAGTKPTAAFTANPLTGCASEERQFYNKSTGSVTNSLWIFGDSELSDLKSPIHHYQDTGLFTVKLIVSDNGCEDSTEIVDYIYVNKPVASFDTKIDCSDRFRLKFVNTSIPITKRLWDFGDGETSTAVNPVHIYASKGTYIVRLISAGTPCSDTAYDTLYIKTGNPEVTVSPLSSFYCKNDSLQFSVINYDSAATRFFIWDFKDSITTYRTNLNTINHVYTKTGVFKPEVVVRDYANCRDTIPIIDPVTIKGPVAQFQTASTSCTNAQTNFKNTSVADASAVINQWLWRFGDGNTATTAGPLNHAYLFPGIYNANLKITDTNNCSDSVAQPIEILITPTIDAGNDTLVCAGTGITLTPAGASSYIWQSHPDLSCTNCSNPVANPYQPAVYYVEGTTNGCSASDSIRVNVQAKKIITAEPDSYSICPGDSVTLNVTGSDSYSWTPANTLNNSAIANPVASPVSNTTYTVVGKDNNNCFADTAAVKVKVNAPPTVNITDSIVQLMIGTTFTILATASSDANQFEWLPATGLSCYKCLQPQATVTSTITYTLKAANNFGCVSNDSITIISVCTDKFIFLPNTFSPNNDGMNDYFYPRSNTGIKIKSLTIFNRWGQMVFQKKNIQINNAADGWDGKYKNVLQAADVYVYIMELDCSGGKVFTSKGNVSLLR